MHNEYKAQDQDKTKNAESKVDLSLVPWGAMPKVARVMMFGAKKYKPLGFYGVPNRRWTYIKASMRHMAKFFVGVARGVENPRDEETGLPHLDHACADLMIAIDDSCEDAEEFEVEVSNGPVTAKSAPHPEQDSPKIVIGIE